MSSAETGIEKYDKSFFGHPSGLSTLFFTEMWERFSYYGMRALLVLYMVAGVPEGGLGFSTADATAIYGLYTASVYFLPLIGGWIADRFIGVKRSTFIGGVIIAAGHFSLAVPTLTFFYLGLVLVAIGTGFLKSNISAMVGDLYSEGDERRDGGFSIFYMGINLGGLISPLACGFLAQSETFRNFIAGFGLDPRSSWHFGFALAGVGMVAGLIQYVVGKRHLDGVGEAPVKKADDATAITPSYIIQISVLVVVCVAIILSYLFAFSDATLPMADRIRGTITSVIPPVMIIGGLVAVILTGLQDKLSTDEWKRLGIIIILFLLAALFWAGFEQQGSSFSLFADQLTQRTFGSFEIPASWFQSINGIMIVIMAPIFGILWVRMGKKQPNDVFKFALGLFFLALGFIVMAYASGLTGAGKVSPMWLVSVFFLHTCGELCLSPVGLSSMTKLAPGKMVGLMLGVWFLASSLGSFAAGQIAGEFKAEAGALGTLFTNVAIVVFIGAAIAFVLSFIVGGFLRSRQTTAEVPVEPA
ncbi:MAG: peptide MFS transporter [Acidobacteria bacterium]|nr:peptide MFS transporter [Acidobacteriota bacterium]